MEPISIGIIITIIIIFLWRSLVKHSRRIQLYKYADENYLAKKDYIDGNGYKRNKGDRLIHRDIAYHRIYKKGYRIGLYVLRFREYDIHHTDGNKRNNAIENLQILTRQEHKEKHGF